MARHAWLTLSTLLLLLGLVLPGQAEELTAAALTGYPPYSDEDLPEKGFANDLLVQAMRRSGHAVRIVMLPWARALDEAASGRYDIIPALWRTEEREEILVFSAPFIMNRLVFAKPASSDFEFTSLDSLTGRTVGTVIGYAYDEAFLDSTDFVRDPARDVVLNLRRLAAGRIGLTLDDEQVLTHLLNTTLKDLKGQIALTRGALVERGLYMGFPKARPDAARLAEDFNRGLAGMREDGSYAALLAKHGIREQADPAP